MSRQNLYELVEKRGITPTQAFARIRYYYDHIVYTGPNEQYITLHDFIERYVFEKLPIRGTCINLDDLLKDIHLSLYKDSYSMDEVLLFIEYILCAIDATPKELAETLQLNADLLDTVGIYNKITEEINTILNLLSMTVIDSEHGRIVVPSNYKVCQAAAITTDRDISWDLLQYNHFTNNGNLKEKQAILKRLGDYIEPVLQKRSNDNSEQWAKTAELASNLLNNFQIRHNNRAGTHKREYVTSMDDSELEEWYDNTYNVIVELIIEKEGSDIKRKVDLLQGK